MSHEIQNTILKYLEKMNCTDIEFAVMSSDRAVVRFNCKDLTSFTGDLVGWEGGGIALDDSKTRQYKIEFRRNNS